MEIFTKHLEIWVLPKKPSKSTAVAAALSEDIMWHGASPTQPKMNRPNCLQPTRPSQNPAFAHLLTGAFFTQRFLQYISKSITHTHQSVGYQTGQNRLKTSYAVLPLSGWLLGWSRSTQHIVVWTTWQPVRGNQMHHARPWVVGCKGLGLQHTTFITLQDIAVNYTWQGKPESHDSDEYDKKESKFARRKFWSPLSTKCVAVCCSVL